MSEPERARRFTDTETGRMPRIDVDPPPVDPPPPPVLPEFPDPAGATGRFEVLQEHEDAARLADDSATSSASKGAAPAKP